uniref:Uncharacterized protein n=1 Tax=Panagrolaimus sp. ES5 TaxID=591445 RepID=A0AC34G8U6_9BILA
MDSENLKKLYKTCKYFYACFKINIIDDLYFSKKSDISAFCINEHLKDLQLEGFPKTINAFGLHTSQLNQLPGNLWLTGEIALFDISNLSPLFSKIIRCDLFGAFIATDMTINEFAFLTHSQTIKRIYVTGKIYSSNKKTEVAPLEDILLHLLSADYLR